MPPLKDLPAPKLTVQTRVWMSVLRCYLIVAVALIAYRIVLAAFQ